MGILRGLGKIVGVAVRTAVVLPTAIVRDVVTFGGELTDGRIATTRQARKIAEEMDDAIEELGD